LAQNRKSDETFYALILPFTFFRSPYKIFFMSLLKIVHYPEPVLLTVGKPVSEFDAELKKLVEDMFETMYDAGGVGLAAPQIGESKRLFVMDCSGGDDESQKIALINPEIIAQEGEQDGDEGCLSFPGIYTKVQRELRVVVRAQDVNGETFELDGTDLTARCVLHETDHCDGIVFLDRMTLLKREMAKRKIKRLQKTGKWD
jgi:peptide deformylase